MNNSTTVGVATETTDAELLECIRKMQVLKKQFSRWRRPVLFHGCAHEIMRAMKLHITRAISIPPVIAAIISQYYDYSIPIDFKIHDDT